jgi:hypothetical protein
MQFPVWRYHATADPRLITSAEEHEALGEGWADTPAAHGIETAPGATPDPDIAANAAVLGSAARAETSESDAPDARPANKRKRK